MRKLLALLLFACPLANLHLHAQATHKALLLFGGASHKEFLGCLNCSKSSNSSICNPYGTYGSKFNAQSIWNPYGTFGSKFNSSSPWNEFSQDAPIIVDSDGNSYGYFTVNKYHRSRTKIAWLLAILAYEAAEDNLEETHQVACSE